MPNKSVTPSYLPSCYNRTFGFRSLLEANAMAMLAVVNPHHTSTSCDMSVTCSNIGSASHHLWQTLSLSSAPLQLARLSPDFLPALNDKKELSLSVLFILALNGLTPERLHQCSL